MVDVQKTEKDQLLPRKPGTSGCDVSMAILAWVSHAPRTLRSGQLAGWGTCSLASPGRSRLGFAGGRERATWGMTATGEVGGDNADEYSKFSEMLGIEEQTKQEPTAEKVVKPAIDAPRKIDPADYGLFDQMLQKSGGAGRKPLKGGKRWQTTAVFRESGSKSSSSAPTPSGSPADIDDVPDKAVIKSPSLSKDELVEAYQFMQEEFGSGVHAETRVPPKPVATQVGEQEQPLPTLLQPPSHHTLETWNPDVAKPGPAAKEVKQLPELLQPPLLRSKPALRSEAVSVPAVQEEQQKTPELLEPPLRQESVHPAPSELTSERTLVEPRTVAGLEGPVDAASLSAAMSAGTTTRPSRERRANSLPRVETPPIVLDNPMLVIPAVDDNVQLR